MITAVVALFLGVQTAEAHPHGNNGKKITHGVRTGQLTKGEAMRLRAQQHQLKNMKRVAMADGRITRNERVVINRTKHRMNANVYRLKHNGRTRGCR